MECLYLYHYFIFFFFFFLQCIIVKCWQIVSKNVESEYICISLDCVIRNSLNNYAIFSSFLSIVPFVSKAPAVILACQCKPFDLSPSFKINNSETVSGWKRKCSHISNKAICSVVVRTQLGTVRMTVLRLGKTCLIFDLHDKTFKSLFCAYCLPWKLFMYSVWASSTAGQSNSAFVIFEEIAGGLEVKCL